MRFTERERSNKIVIEKDRRFFYVSGTRAKYLVHSTWFDPQDTRYDVMMKIKKKNEETNEESHKTHHKHEMHSMYEV